MPRLILDTVELDYLAKTTLEDLQRRIQAVLPDVKPREVAHYITSILKMMQTLQSMNPLSGPAGPLIRECERLTALIESPRNE